jgi:hypothetical protein
MKTSLKIVFVLILILICVGVTNASDDNTIFNDNGSGTTSVTIFPNPVLDNQFSITSDVSIAEVVIINILGQEVYKRINLNQNKIIIEFESIENGLYLVQVKTADDRVITRRVLFR